MFTTTLARYGPPNENFVLVVRRRDRGVCLQGYQGRSPWLVGSRPVLCLTRPLRRSCTACPEIGCADSSTTVAGNSPPQDYPLKFRVSLFLLGESGWRASGENGPQCPGP